MRLPIALTPINGVLIIMMLLAPYMGKLAREIVLKKNTEENLDNVLSRRPVIETKNRKKRPRKKTVSRLAMLEKIESQNRKNNNDDSPKSTKINESDKVGSNEVQLEFHKGKQLLAQLKSKHTNNQNPARKLSSAEKRQAFVKELKELARSRNYSEAEKIFLGRLEGMNLSPLESLDKQAKFQSHFNRLVEQLEKKSNL